MPTGSWSRDATRARLFWSWTEKQPSRERIKISEATSLVITSKCHYLNKTLLLPDRAAELKMSVNLQIKKRKCVCSILCV
jgi:hypothetical protein